MKKRILTILILGVILLSGCLDDKTNLDYQEVIVPERLIVRNVVTNEIDNFTLSSSIIYNVDSGKEIQLDIDSVVYKGDDELEFEWKLGGKIISKGKSLRYVCTEGGVCMLYVLRKKAGNATAYQFRIIVNDPFDSGLVVLAKNGGKTQLDWIERFYTPEDVTLGGEVYPNFTRIYYIEHADIYSLYNNGEQLSVREPIKIERGKGGIDPAFLSYQIVSSDWENSLAVNARTMQKIVDLKDEFVEIPENIKIKDYVNVGLMSFILDGSGRIFSRGNYDKGVPHTGRFTPVPLVLEMNGESEEIQANLIWGQQEKDILLVYEKNKKRFLVVSVPMGYSDVADFAPVYDLATVSNPGDLPRFEVPYVNLNSFDKNVKAVLFGSNLYSNIVYIIYEDNAEYYIQSCEIYFMRSYGQIYTRRYTAKSTAKLPAEAGRMLEAGNFNIQISSYLGKDIMYFAVSNTLYAMTMEGNNVDVIFKNEGNAAITKFAMTSTWNDNTTGIWERYFNGRVFAIALDNGDFKVIKLFYDPYHPESVSFQYWVDKHYDGSVIDIKFYQN